MSNLINLIYISLYI